MSRYPLEFAAGIVSDDTVLARIGRWIDGSMVRWVRGRPQLVGGWERLTLQALEGVCRNIFAWSDTAGSLNIAFGTHSKLFVWKGGGLFDITPTLSMPAATLGGLLTPGALAVADASAVVTVSHPDHGLETGEEVVVAGAVAVGRIIPNGTFPVTRIDADHYSYTFTSPADLAETLGANPLTTTSGSPVVTVADTAHGLPDGLVVTISGAAAVGGITPNGQFPITVIDANSYRYTFTSNASSGATGGAAAVVVTVPAEGGGPAVRIAPQRAYQPGQINGTGGRGYGTGAYGVGAYGVPSDTEYFPRTWSFGSLGQALVASPRAGAVYIWENNTAAKATPIPNSPRQVSAILVTPERVILALGCNKEDGSGFDPRCIRHCDRRIVLGEEPGFEVWRTDVDTLAREKILEGAGRLVAGRVAGYGNLIWTDNEVLDCRYVGALDEIYSFTRLGEKCGLIGPNAAAVDNQRAFWLGPDFQFRTVALGGEPAVIESPMREELEDNIAPVQKDKIVCSTIAGFNEVWFFYPDRREGLENSRAMYFSKADGWWGKAVLARTAFNDAGPASYPVGVTAGGVVYWHERGKSADGDAIAWRLDSGPQYIDEGERLILFRDFVPDFKDQEGAINLTLFTREESQSAPESFGPFAMSPATKRVGLKGVGRLVSFSLSGASGPAFWRLGTPIFEGREAGRR